MDNIPLGLCQCGCGRRTTIATKTATARGAVKGQPNRYLKGHIHKRSPHDYLIEDRGHDTPCWVWAGATTGRNARTVYGQMWHEGAMRKSHRVYYERTNGPIPNSLQLDHLCRVTLCVNPDHLEAVTGSENTYRGNLATLTHAQVRQLREDYETGQYNQKEIAARFGISHAQANAILKGRCWKELL